MCGQLSPEMEAELARARRERHEADTRWRARQAELLAELELERRATVVVSQTERALVDA